MIVEIWIQSIYFMFLLPYGPLCIWLSILLYCFIAYAEKYSDFNDGFSNNHLLSMPTRAYDFISYFSKELYTILYMVWLLTHQVLQSYIAMRNGFYSFILWHIIKPFTYNFWNLRCTSSTYQHTVVFLLANKLGYAQMISCHMARPFYFLWDHKDLICQHARHEWEIGI